MEATTTYPRHIALIMDGNGRWAKKRLLPRTAGHKKAISRVRDIIEHCASQKIEALTLFAFSSENWSRPEDEVSALMALLLHSLQRETKKLHDNNVQFRVIGDTSLLTPKLQQTISHAETLTRSNTGLKLRLAINYGGKWDLVNAVKCLIENLNSTEVNLNTISESMIAQYLSTADLPDPDLFIRTSDEHRISNFLLWQLAYSELYFSDTLFPDFSIEHLTTAIEWFQLRERRFGKTSEQITVKGHNET